MLAFILPLKVILLAGAEGVPRYFSFIDPVDKLGWVLGLSATAVFCYGAALVLEAFAEKVSVTTSQRVVRNATQLVVVKNQDSEARGYFSTLCGIGADLTFVLLGLGVGFILDTRTFSFLTVLLLMGAVVVYAVIRRRVKVAPVAGVGGKPLNNFLKGLQGLAFLLSFLWILLPFLVEQATNILVAIVSIVIIRQILKVLVGVVRDAFRISERRSRVDALFLPRVQIRTPEQREDRLLRELFQKERRDRLAAAALAGAVAGAEQYTVSWADPFIKGVNAMLIHPAGSPSSSAKFLQRVYSPANLLTLQHEDLLFQHIPRDRLAAPELDVRYSVGPFACQVSEYGPPKVRGRAAWRRMESHLTEFYWGIQPPRSLIKAFGSGRMSLHQRLRNDLTERVAVAVDNEKEAAALEFVEKRLGQLRRRIKQVPLFVRNPAISPRTVVVPAGREFCVVSWGEWELEPLGAGLAEGLSQEQVELLLTGARNARSDIPSFLTPLDVAVVAEAWRFERYARARLFKRALGHAEVLAELLTRLERRSVASMTG